MPSISMCSPSLTTDGDHVGFGLLAHHRDAPRALAQRWKASDMVGVQVCIDRFYQPQVQLLQELNVTINLFEDRVDD